MKRLIVFRILVFVFISFLLFSQIAFAAEKLTKIADSVYSYVDIKNSTPQKSYGANAGIIIGKDGIVVIDTLISAKEARRFIRDIRAISKKPIKYVINTHYHLDHTFGNSEFAKLGAVIISHINDSNNLKAQGETALKNAKNYGLSKEDMKGTKIAYPALSFNDRMEIALGDQRIDLIYTGHSHTDGSITVYLPDKKILFSGDILFTGYHPFIGDGSIGEWVKALDHIMTMNVEKIIPGHGPLSNKKDIQDMKDYLIAFDKKAKELAAKSNDAEYIASEIKKSLPSRPEGAGLILWNIQMKYLKK
ncbi:MAG: MBL fold metallo-hydrolase [Nitrospirae bacterium GWF2_44_13]|nr:MAG: MBL fold metallo-hydrolase [Nitrospirae bacterium GWF2_44_13]OGW63750.1 MAG: MBL fold metallo-hydrolase [Nitrospirae bacterium RIFOXYA2_FULL_44_9]HBG92935.1 MBL fold metallo-hydrolase [Nitrospiraceae bacterium]HBU05901.1 MBL fold metallo-hydrolase [Nitrospiraceae bacterium]